MLVVVGVLLVTGCGAVTVDLRALHRRLQAASSDDQRRPRAAADTRLATAARAAGCRARPVGWRAGRWRQLTSMRTALVLLFLLALAAIPGSVAPAERRRRAARCASCQAAAPDADADLRAARRCSTSTLAVVRRDLPAADGLAGRLHRAARVRRTARRCARGRPPRRATSPGCRTTRSYDDRRRAGGRRSARGRGAARRGATASTSATTTARSSAERGYLREAGNLLFHLSVLVLLVGFAARQPVRLQGRRDRRRGQRLLQHPDAVRRLHARAAGSPSRRPGAVLVHGRQTSRATYQRAAAAGQAPRTLRGEARRTQTRPTRAAHAGTTPGQPPAQHRRHQGLPGRPRLRARCHRARRQGQRRCSRARWRSCRRTRNFTSIGVVKVPDAPARRSSASRASSCRRPSVDPARVGRSRVPRRARTRGLHARALHRRPRPRHRRAAVGLQARHRQRMTSGPAARRSRPGRPGSCRTARGSITFDGVPQWATSRSPRPRQGPRADRA